MSASRGVMYGIVGLIIGALVTGGVVAAFGTDDDSIDPATIDGAYVPIDPCRLFDLRPDGVGPRSGPLGPGEVYTQPVTGQIGDCVIPQDASSVALNVTITQPSANSFLTIFPGDLDEVPNVSHHNWLANQAPTPAPAYVRLGTDGDLKFYNDAGNVFVLVDVLGYRTAADPVEAADYQLSLTIPDGVTVRGNIVVSAPGDGEGRVNIDFPGTIPVALADGDVLFSDEWIDADGGCDGSPENPTAPSGKLCIYPSSWNNIDQDALTATPGVLPTHGFTVGIVGDGVTGSTAVFEGTWAYTP